MATMADSRSESKKNLLNALSQIIGISENFEIKRVNLNVREHSMKLFDLIEGGYFTGVFADALAELLNDLSEIFEKGAKYND